jgi:serine/threonine protein kinase
MAAKITAPPKISRGEFARNLAESGLFEPGDLLPDSGPPAVDDGAEAAQELVAAGKLTGFQADAILRGRFAELRLGNYEIMDRLGAGGMGTVFKARHRRMKRVVALKLLSREVAEKFADRFQREVETIARLTHPNIVMAYDADECEAGPFLVMEYVNGRDLSSEVIAHGPLPVADAADRILQAARGLEYAHGQGIIHRDIKPGNILRDADGVVKVADLGLARLTKAVAESGERAALTQAGTVFGTVDYMSPEQAVDSGTVDRRADIYSLGCTLFFLLTGDPMYEGGTLMSTMIRHRESPIPPLIDTRSDVPAELEAIYRRMVAKQPDDRYPTMAAVAAALERFLSAATTGLPGTPAPTHPAAPTARTDQTMDLTSTVSGAVSSLDFEIAQAGAAGLTPEQRGQLSRLTVVVAEASRTQAGIIRNYLQQLGVAATHTSGSGRQAVELVKQFGAAAVVSSLHLSDMTGIRLAEALRGDPSCARVGFVLATSETDADSTAGLPTDSRTTVMPKPFDPHRLAQSVLAVVG